MGFGVDKCACFAYNNPVTAEVAEAISIDSVGQLPDLGKGLSPKVISDAKRVFPGAAQKMRGTVIRGNLRFQKNVVLPGKVCVFPVRMAQGFLIV